MFSVYDVDHGVVGLFVGMRRDGGSWRLAFDPLPSVGMERQGRLRIGVACFVWLYLYGAFFNLDFVGVGLSRRGARILERGSIMIEFRAALD